MALQLAAAHALNHLPVGSVPLDNVFAARGVAGFTPNTGALEARADGPSSVNIFIDAEDTDYEYAVSVVQACATETVYLLQCTKGSSDACGDGAPAITVTENASEYKVSSAATTTTAGVEVKVTAIEHCALDGKTAATCTATIGGSAQGQKTTTSATVTYTDASDLFFDVTVTAGNEKLANPTGKCSGAASLTTRAVALWGLVGAIGAISVLAL
ncbi:hypothetical protein F4802DRAFT_597067 [Xylaria palmicola]|nr:hypothetical protein F4802DRAFT_597067 [Xylaria palmicola]